MNVAIVAGDVGQAHGSIWSIAPEPMHTRDGGRCTKPPLVAAADEGELPGVGAQARRGGRPLRIGTARRLAVAACRAT